LSPIYWGGTRGRRSGGIDTADVLNNGEINDDRDKPIRTRRCIHIRHNAEPALLNSPACVIHHAVSCWCLICSYYSAATEIWARRRPPAFEYRRRRHMGLAGFMSLGHTWSRVSCVSAHYYTIQRRQMRMVTMGVTELVSDRCILPRQAASWYETEGCRYDAYMMMTAYHHPIYRYAVMETSRLASYRFNPSIKSHKQTNTLIHWPSVIEIVTVHKMRLQPKDPRPGIYSEVKRPA